ncbi:D-cysteine desulfhydrase, partial [Burkholderia pseudomallei]
VIGVTVSRTDAQQRPKVRLLVDGMSGLLVVALPAGARLELWDDYFAPRYGEPYRAGIDALRLLARTQWLLLSQEYTGKPSECLIDSDA